MASKNDRKKDTSYSEQRDRKLKEKLNEKTENLPGFCKQFFLGLQDDDDQKALSTCLAYAVDLSIFFEYVKEEKDEYKDTEIKDLPLECLENIKMSEMKYFIKSYLPSYERNGINYENKRNSRARKLATLKKFYHFYLNSEEPYTITNDPVSAITIKKEKKGEMKYIEPNKTAQILDDIEDSEGACGRESSRQDKWDEKTWKRDFAIVSLLLGTGMRVSECVGINLQDIDFEDGSIHIVRKGGNNDRVFLSDEVESALRSYLYFERDSYEPEEKDKDAFFLSRKHKRITVRSVERMVKKYTTKITGKNIYTPHSLRATFGTNLLEESGNLQTVKEALGHASTETTSKYYVKTKDSVKREAFRSIQLR